MTKLDQYAQNIPNDLVTVPDIEVLDENGIKIIESARWYVAHFPNGHQSCILVSAKEIQYLSEDDPIDSGIDLNDPEIRIDFIQDFLKRHSVQGVRGKRGFYHA